MTRVHRALTRASVSRWRKRFGVSRLEVARCNADHWRQRALIAEQEAHERGELLQAILLAEVTQR